MKQVLITDIETPYFLVDLDELKKNVTNLKKEFQKRWNNTIIGYSFKTNSLPWIITTLKKMGLYAEVVSKDEYELAKFLGYDINKIIYNGPIKSKETFLEALNYGAIVNIDSFQEIEWLKEIKLKSKNEKFKIGIRINFDLEKYCPNETSAGKRGSRFGFNFENDEFLKAIELLKKIENITIIGIHLHASSKTRSLNIYKELTKFAIVVKKMGINLEYIDIGGGFFGGLSNKPQYSEYAETICEILKKEFSEKTSLIIEPGAAIIASPISFITEVKSVKEVKEIRIITINGSCINLNPLMQNKKYFYKFYFKDKEKRKKIQKQLIVGFTCMENDELFELNDEVEFKEGDLIEFQKIGSYTMTLSPLFIEYFPTVVIKDENKYYLVRERWTYKEIIQKNYF